MTRVLVVEDDENLRLAVTAELARGGADVRGVAGLAAADAELASAAPDCVVFDRMLPDGDAADYVGRRRRAGNHHRSLTARESRGERRPTGRRGRACGAPGPRAPQQRRAQAGRPPPTSTRPRGSDQVVRTLPAAPGGGSSR